MSYRVGMLSFRSRIGLVLVTCLAATGCEHGHGDVSEILELEGDPWTGLVVYEQTCALTSCHGPQGDDGSAPDLGDLTVAHTDEQLAGVVKFGAHDMPAQDHLSDQDIADVIAFLRIKFD